MERAYLIGNGSLTATGDRFGALLDLYAPTLSAETGWLRRPARIGVAVDGLTRWLPDSFEPRASETTGLPIADVSLESAELDLELWIETYVDSRLPILVRRVQVTNRAAVHRSLTLYFHHDFDLANGRPLESARRDEETRALLHTSGRRAALFNLSSPEGIGVPLVRVVGRAPESRATADAEAASGARDPRAEAEGIVDSVGGVGLSLAAGESALVTAWLAVGGSPGDVRSADAAFRREGLAGSLLRTRAHWNLWASEGAREFADLPELVGSVYAASVLALRLHQTPEGAIVSGLDADVGDRAQAGTGSADAAGEPPWCRLADAAIAADSLGRAGYHGAARRYFAFVRDAAGREGRLSAAYEPSGEAITLPGDAEAAVLGSALHLWALARHAERDRDVEFLAPMWDALIVPAADRLAASLDARTSLPRSTDWWHEHDGTHAVAAGAVRGGLRAAARLAAFFGEAPRARAWSAAADRIARAVTASLAIGTADAFRRAPDDDTADASLLLLGLLDDFEPEDPRVRATVALVRERLWVRTGTGGLARYERDLVGSVGGSVAESGEIPGSPNVAATLWLALHATRGARNVQGLEPARTLLFWAAARAEGIGLLPERLHPYRGRTTGPIPSLRAHAWFVQAAVDYGERLRLLTRCDRCGEPAPARRERRRVSAADPAPSAARGGGAA